jgi:hypothetical protein
MVAQSNPITAEVLNHNHHHPQIQEGELQSLASGFRCNLS